MTSKMYIGLTGYAGWCGLGCVRGVKSYKYDHNKYKQGRPYMYSDAMFRGTFGIMVYANPIFFPLVVHKEIYRLEADIRNLDDRVKNDYYHHLI
jgi:hypothetical protein